MRPKTLPGSESSTGKARRSLRHQSKRRAETHTPPGLRIASPGSLAMAFSRSENKGVLSPEGRKSICATCCRPQRRSAFLEGMGADVQRFEAADRAGPTCLWDRCVLSPRGSKEAFAGPRPSMAHRVDRRVVKRNPQANEPKLPGGASLNAGTGLSFGQREYAEKSGSFGPHRVAFGGRFLSNAGSEGGVLDWG